MYEREHICVRYMGLTVPESLFSVHMYHQVCEGVEAYV